MAHLIPTQAALGLVQIDPVPYTNERRLPIIGTQGGMARLNLDGALVLRNETPQGETHGYSQFFRNGFFECTYVLSGGTGQGRVPLRSLQYESDLISLLKSFRGELDRLGINYECAVMLSLLRADQVQLAVRSNWDLDVPNQTLFDRKILVLPDILARLDVTPEQAMKPAFDMMWQAAGFVGSRNYNAAGEWAPGS